MRNRLEHDWGNLGDPNDVVNSANCEGRGDETFVFWLSEDQWEASDIVSIMEDDYGEKVSEIFTNCEGYG